MQGVVYSGLGEAAIGTLPVREPEPDEVVLRVRASGICHTDIDVLHGRYGPGSFPLVPGHEFAGEIVDVGSAVTQLSAGDRVVVDPNIHCGSCGPCGKGLHNLCEQLGAYGVTLDGGFAEFCTLKASSVLPLGDMPFARAALAEPMGCVLNGLATLNGVPRANSLIFGAGPIGLLMALALKAKGCEDVTLVDLADDRLEFAGSFGLNALHAQDDCLTTMKRSFDLVIDATGDTDVAGELANYCANGGGVLFFGVCPPGARIQISPFEVFRRQLRLAGAHSLNHNIGDALQTIKHIGPEIDRLVSHRVALTEVPAFLTEQAPENALKVQAVFE